jgi:hypothetical protein
MTSSIPTMRTAEGPRTVPDSGLVLRRADRDWRRDIADDPAPEGYLEHLAAAVLAQVVGPLAAGATPAADPAHAAQVQTLTAANAALADKVTGLRAGAARHAATGAELDQAQRALTDARGENTQLTTTITGLQTELAAARADITRLTTTAAQTEAASRVCTRHLYPWIEGTRDAGPCACGHAFPRAALRDPAESHAAARAGGAEPLDVLFGRLRRQLPGWPAA